MMFWFCVAAAGIFSERTFRGDLVADQQQRNQQANSHMSESIVRKHLRHVVSMNTTVKLLRYQRKVFCTLVVFKLVLYQSFIQNTFFFSCVFLRMTSVCSLHLSLLNNSFSAYSQTTRLPPET